jgi:hypothetical protein
MDETRTHVHRRRWRQAEDGLAAAAVMVAVAACSTGEDGTEPSPVADLDAAAVASSFVEAAYAYDLDRAETMLGADVEIVDSDDVADWRKGMAWPEAAGYSLADLSCEEGATSAAGTEVHCVYALNALGSEKLGRGPYGGNTFDLTVLDNKITKAEDHWPYVENGFSEEMWEPFEDWVTRQHPADLRLMYTDGELLQGADFEESLRLWKKNIAEYVASHQ